MSDVVILVQISVDHPISPSRDILEELYKIVRNNKTPSYAGINIPRTPSSGSSQFPFSSLHRRHMSDASNASDAGRTKSPASRDGTASPKFQFRKLNPSFTALPY